MHQSIDALSIQRRTMTSADAVYIFSCSASAFLANPGVRTAVGLDPFPLVVEANAFGDVAGLGLTAGGVDVAIEAGGETVGWRAFSSF